MNSLKIVLVSTALLAVALAAEESSNSTGVKEETAGGYGYAADNYGAQSTPYYGYDGYFPQSYNLITDNYICSEDVSYLVYGGRRKHNNRPMKYTCDATRFNKKKNNCNRCCQNSARLYGISQTSVVGFEVVIDSLLSCTCCAPISQATQPIPTTSYAAPVAQPYAQQAPAQAYGQAASQGYGQPVAQAPVQTYGQPIAQAPSQGYAQPIAQAPAQGYAQAAPVSY